MNLTRNYSSFDNIKIHARKLCIIAATTYSIASATATTAFRKNVRMSWCMEIFTFSLSIFIMASDAFTGIFILFPFSPFTLTKPMSKSFQLAKIFIQTEFRITETSCRVQCCAVLSVSLCLMRERAQKQRQQEHANGNGGNGKQHQILALDCIALHTHLNDEKYVRNWIECIRIYSLKHLCTNTLCVTCHFIVIKFKFSSSQWNLPNRLDQRRKFHFRFLSLSLSFSAFVVLVSFFCW